MDERGGRHAQLRALARAAARWAQNLQPSGSDADDEALARRATMSVECLIEEASTAWNDGFRAVLAGSQAARIVDLPRASRERLRETTAPCRCQACGRHEELGYALDLAGTGDPSRAWMRMGASATDWYDQYATVRARAVESDGRERTLRRASDGELPRIDMGRYVIGKTCMKRAVLVLALQTLGPRAAEQFEAVLGNAGVDVHDGVAADVGPMGVSAAITPEAVDEAADAMGAELHACETAIALDVHRAPDPPYDNALWSVVDACRHRVAREWECDGIEDVVRVRTDGLLLQPPEERPVAADGGRGSQRPARRSPRLHEAAPARAEGVLARHRRPARKRARAPLLDAPPAPSRIDDDDDESVVGGAASSTRGGSTKRRRRVVVSDDESDGPDGPDGPAAVVDEAARRSDALYSIAACACRIADVDRALMARPDGLFAQAMALFARQLAEVHAEYAAGFRDGLDGRWLDRRVATHYLHGHMTGAQTRVAAAASAPDDARAATRAAARAAISGAAGRR